MDPPSVPRSDPTHPHGREAMWNAITRISGEPSPDRKPRPKLDWRRALRLEGLRLRRDSRRPERRLLRRLHGAWDTLAGEVLFFCPCQAIRTYARSAARLGADLPADLDAMLEDARRLSRRIAPFRPVLCHNDLLPANLIEDGRRLWLVDWEYGGVGHPLFDLANASANAAM